MRKFRFITCLLTAALLAAAFSGCGSTTVKTSDISPAQGQGQPGQDQPGMQKERGTIAKVVSLNGDRLTVIPADMTEPGGNGAPPVSGAAFGPDKSLSGPGIGQDMTSSGPGVRPDRTSSEPAFGADNPGSNSGAEGPGMPRDGSFGSGGREITFTGTEVSYPLSPNVTIEKGTGKDAKEIDLSGLAANDVIRFTTAAGDDGTEMITAIVVMDQAI